MNWSSKFQLPSSLQLFGPYLRKHPWALLRILVVILIFIAAGRSLPFIFGHAVDEGLKKQNLNLIFKLAFLYAALEILRTLSSFLTNYLSQKLGNRMLAEIRFDLVHHTLRLPMRFFDRTPSGRTVTRLTNDVFALGELFNQGLATMVVNGIELVSIAVALLYLSPSLTVVVLVLAVGLVALSRQLSIKIREKYVESKKMISSMNSFTAESINGMETIKIFDLGAQRNRRFRDLSKDYCRNQLDIVRLFALLWPLLNSFSITAVAITLSIAALFPAQLPISIGQLASFILLLQSFFRPIRVILERLNQFQNSLTSGQRISDLIREPTEDYSQATRTLPDLKGVIEFKNVSFRYSAEGPDVLKSINLKIEPGQAVALVGRTGSGKSTLIKLLQKFYQPTSGEILVDNTPLQLLDYHEVRRKVGVIQQDPLLFRGTVLSNLTFGDPTISSLVARQAADQARCLPFLERRGKGLETLVDEKGSNMSGGERQLVALARLFVFAPEILVLDEATSHVDSESELFLQQATEEMMEGRTTLIIAHRLSTIQRCDRIIVLDNGQIVEEGSHETLLKVQGKYWGLWQSQLRHHDIF